MALESEQTLVGNTAQESTQPPVRVRLGLATRLSLALVSAVAFVFITAFYYDYRQSHRHMLGNVNAAIAGLSGAIIGNLQGILADVTDVASELAQAVEQGKDIEALRAVAVDAITDSSYCNVAMVTLDSQTEAAASQIQAQMLNCRYRHSKVICNMTRTAVNREPMVQASSSKALKQAIWSEPFLDANSGEAVSAYMASIYRMEDGARVKVGVVSAELPLSSLASAIQRLRIFGTGYVFILSGEGRYLAHLDTQRDMSETIFDVARFHKNQDLLAIGQRMIRGETGFAALWSPYLQKPARIYFTPLPGTGWSIGVVFGEEELFANLQTLAREVLLIGSVGLLLLLALVVLIVRRFTRPLLVLTEKSAAIAGGDLEVAIPPPRIYDEVGVLTQSFADMRQALRQQLDILAGARAAQARIDNELKIARAIQDSFLPRDPVGLAAQGGLEIATWFEPAREVGGDLFQCFWLADGRLFLCIGDVSGKGIPAALMMAVTTTLVKAMAATTPDPADVLAQVNRELCILNERLLFVTFFAAALHPKTGVMTFGNAGHNPPLIRHADGNVEFMRMAPELVLGVESDWSYASAALRLPPGDMLLLYTDGVTEAMNTAGECFDSRRLLEVCRAPDIAQPRQLIERVIAAVALHVGSAEQSDDLTLLAVAHPNSPCQTDCGGANNMRPENSDAKTACLRLPAELDHLPVFLGHIREIARNAGLGEAKISRLELAVEEALVNVFNHAYDEQTRADGAVFCEVATQTDGLTVEIVDQGPPFDPLARPDPDTALEIDQRQPGGLGILLIKTLVDEARYRREDGRNVLTLHIDQSTSISPNSPAASEQGE